MDPSAEHHQELTGSDDQSLESILAGPTKPPQKKPKPHDEEALKCPRCESTNTKFCYYNNYSLSQPRYFCKSCRRYWTKGGTLRNVPVGGGCRKSKRSSSSKRIMVTSSHQEHHQDHPHSHSHSHSLDDLIALNLSGNPFAGLHDLAYDASNLYFPLTFAHQLHKLTGGQFDGQDLSMGLGLDQEFVEAPSTGNIPGPYYGLGDGAIGVEFANNGSGVSGDRKLPFEDLKQDFCSVDNWVLLGSPWSVNGEGISNMDDISSMRHGFGFGSTWPSLLNSPLM